MPRKETLPHAQMDVSGGVARGAALTRGSMQDVTRGATQDIARGSTMSPVSPVSTRDSTYLLSAARQPEDAMQAEDAMQNDSMEPVSEYSLRPRTLDAFVGQSELKQHLEVVLGAARLRNEPAGHLLLAGPPGLGKTTLAHIVATELGAHLQPTSGPALERAGDLAAILTKLAEGDVLFIDEIHRLPRAVEEILYPAMEDFRIDIVLGKGPAARSIPLDIAPFTLVGATTRTGLITGPLRDRFGLVARLDFYSKDDLTLIVERTASIVGVRISRAGAAEIARRARGTPRIANRLLRQVRDFAQIHGEGHIDTETAAEGLAFFSVDELGLDRASRSVIEVLCEHFGGGPVGRSTLAIAVSEPQDTLEDVYEPFLIQQGLLMRTPRGRVATPAAWAHLGLQPPRQQQPDLFF